jgi:hypothetical protein
MCLNESAECNPTENETTDGRRTAVMELYGMKVTPRDQRTVKQHLRTLFLRAGIRDGRKRVRLATAAFERTEAKS